MFKKLKSFFNSNNEVSQLSKYNFDDYDLSNQVLINKYKSDALAVSKILLKEAINNNEDTRYNAGAFLSDWMSKTNEYSFGTGNLKNLFDDRVELAIISMAAQIKYCFENNSNSSYSDESMLGIWKIISEYLENPNYKVKQTAKLRELIKAKNENKLAEFLVINR